jgi:chemotaxis methyl-accepting protein methylase
MSVEPPSTGRGDDAIEALRTRLVERSGFPAEALAGTRLQSLLSRRAVELALRDPAEAAARALDEDAEYARIEAHFSPPETWLFRYRESFEFLREFAASRRDDEIAALVVGAGGWCEPCAIAAALAEGSGGGRMSLLAVDRNPEVFAGEPRFSGLALRGERPSFAGRWFSEDSGALVPAVALRARIAVEVARIDAIIERCVRASLRFDVISCRNVAIYQTAAVRSATYAGLASLLTPTGVFLVGHAEITAAAEATGLTPVGAEGAFALGRSARTAAAAERADEDRRTSRASIGPTSGVERAQPSTPRPAPASLPRVPAPAAPRTPIDAARAAVMVRPTDAALHVALAEALLEAGELTESWHSVQRALYLERGHEAALLTAARISELRGQAEEAARFRSRALRVHLARMRDAERP